jgi:hypothetical protein
MRRILMTGLVTVLAAVGLVVTAPAADAVTGWTTLHRWPAGSVLLACQYTETGGYGPVWHTRLVLAHQPGESVVHLRGSFTVQRMSADGVYRSIGTTRLATDQVGQWDVRDAFGSQIGGQYRGRWYPDRWSRGFGDETGGAGDVNPTSFGTLRHC